jgi:hypothetical protein
MLEEEGGEGEEGNGQCLVYQSRPSKEGAYNIARREK